MLVKDIIKKTLVKIQREGLTVTPDVYSKTFCKIAKQEGLTLNECNPALKFIEKLEEHQKDEAKRKKIEQLDELVIFLINSHKREIKKLSSQSSPLQKKPLNDNMKTAKIYSSIIKEALTPSFTNSLDLEIAQVSKKIDQNLGSLDKKLSDEILHLIDKRIINDKKEILKHAGDVESSVDDILEFINSLIASGKLKESSVQEIQDELDEINKDNFDARQFQHIKDKLSLVASSLNSELSSMTKELETKKREVTDLKGEIATLKKELEKSHTESRTDFLTGVLTKRGLDEAMEEYESKFQKESKDFALIFFDIDHFKNVNDNFGHDVGDVVLKGFSAALKEKSKKSFKIGRFGGEEFVVIVPELSKDAVMKYCESFRSSIEKGIFEYKDKKIDITVSAGITLRSENSSLEQSVKTADNNLYTSKKEGRNRVT